MGRTGSQKGIIARRLSAMCTRASVPFIVGSLADRMTPLEIETARPQAAGQHIRAVPPVEWG